MADVTVIILTYNEQKHLERCIRSVQSFAKDVICVDSFSTDATAEIAQRLGARVAPHKFTNHAEQFNWALAEVPISTEWIMRLDSDEYILPELAEEINARLPTLPPQITGVNLRRRVLFMGRWIRHGGYYPIILLRIFRVGQARSEQRSMDEHIRITHGEAITFRHDFVDENLNDLTWWTDKHNRYATREAADLLTLAHHIDGGDQNSGFRPTTRQAEMKRWLKEKVYARLPIGVRPLLYWLYRYVFQLGFLDGKAGFLWHTLQGFWYRLLVDAKLVEMQRNMQQTGRDAATLLREQYGLTLPPPKPAATDNAAIDGVEKIA